MFLFLAILSLIGALVVGVVLKRIIGQKEYEDEEIRRNKKKFCRQISVIAWILFVLFLVLSCIKIIQPGHVGVPVTLGYIGNRPLNPGLNIVWPVTAVTQMDIRTQAYTMSSVELEGQKSGDDAIDVLSSDGLTLKLDVTVWFRLVGSEATKVYRTVGLDYVEKIVRPAIRAAFRYAAVGISAVDIYSVKRELFVQEVRKRIESEFKDRGIVLENVLLRNVQLPATVKEAIEAKLAAEQEAMKMDFILDKEKKEAERKRIEACGIADAQAIISRNLTQEYLQWLWMKEIRAFGEGPNNSIIVTPYDPKMIPQLLLPVK